MFKIAQEALAFKECLAARIHDPILFQITQRARIIAEHAIDERGRFVGVKIPLPPKGVPLLEQQFMQQASTLLKWLSHSTEGQRLLMQFSFPLAHSFAEKIVRYAVQKVPGESLTLRDIRVCVLSALLTPLRQTVGSCFATAPLMQVQREEPLLHLTDLYALLSTGRLKRIVEGKEVSVPMNGKTGRGALVLPPTPHLGKDPALRRTLQLLDIPFVPPPVGEYSSIETWLEECIPEADVAKEYIKSFTQHPLNKCWEYTVASLSDYQTTTTQATLTRALGLHHEDKEGLGSVLYQFATEELEKRNAQLRERTADLRHVEAEIRTLHILFRNATSLSRKQRLKREIMGKNHHLQVLEDTYEEALEATERFSQFFAFCVEQLQWYIPQYFQEVYDPDIGHISPLPYENTAAGFQLVYKHGRQDPSIWTPLQNEEGFREILLEFLGTIEPFILSAYKEKRGEDIIQEAFSRLYAQVRMPEFMTQAQERLQQAKQEWGLIGELSPWMRLSGGSIEQVLRAYYPLRSEPQSIELVVKEPQDLLEQLLEFLKDAPYELVRALEKVPGKGILMTSAHHAFVFKPQLSPFVEGWQNNELNTYTFVRDHWYLPTLAHYQTLVLSAEDQATLGRASQRPKPLATLCAEYKAALDSLSPVTQREFMQKLIPYLLQHQALKPLYFADTNWKALYFCFVINPLTERWEIWQGTGVDCFPLPEWEGEFTKPWRLYLPPTELLPETWKKV